VIRRAGVIGIVTAVLGGSAPAWGTDGDLYAAGTSYCATTYSPGHDTPRGFGPPLDINAAGGDAGRPVRAPADGTVRVFSRSGIYGLSVVWRSIDGVERIHVAHLQRITATGRVRSGAELGLAGSSGHAFGEGHLHVARRMAGRPVPMELSGHPIVPDRCSVSRGPITATCSGRTATVVGSRKGDRLPGTRGHDVIAALGGDDVVSGRGGDDLVCGAAGRDRLSGGPGDDRLDGGPGADAARGDAGTDACRADRSRSCES
jgi:hypothetical protein